PRARVPRSRAAARWPREAEDAPRPRRPTPRSTAHARVRAVARRGRGGDRVCDRAAACATRRRRRARPRRAARARDAARNRRARRRRRGGTARERRDALLGALSAPERTLARALALAHCRRPTRASREGPRPRELTQRCGSALPSAGPYL